MIYLIIISERIRLKCIECFWKSPWKVIWFLIYQLHCVEMNVQWNEYQLLDLTSFTLTCNIRVVKIVRDVSSGRIRTIHRQLYLREQIDLWIMLTTVVI